MSRIYQKIGHGFVPFLKVLVNACSEESGKYIHYGITTQNIQQSSQLYMMKTVHNKFMLLLSEIIENLSGLAEKTKHMVMPGRTHGPPRYPNYLRVQSVRVDQRFHRLLPTNERV
ncbi:Adenylosuccinate lyase [Providencia alcalifaciens]|nr:Adenylosuccinate lyase [Providencia alcalifaciens]